MAISKKYYIRGFGDVMDWETYREWTRTTAEYPKDREEEYLMVGLANEVGELLGKYKKNIRGDKYYTGETFKEAVVSELGDVLWYFTRLCDTLDISIYEVMEKNVNKLSRRMVQGTIDLQARALEPLSPLRG